MSREPRFKQTDSILVRDEDGKEFRIEVISMFNDVTTDRSTNDEWVEARLKELRAPDGRPIYPVEGEERKYYIDGEPDRILTAID